MHVYVSNPIWEKTKWQNTGDGLKFASFCNVTWCIQRQIHDRTTNQQSVFNGQASVCNGIYAEKGQITLPNARILSATQRYIWRENTIGVDVFFEDGRFFHTFALNTVSPSAWHWCNPDSYAVAYGFTHWPKWTAHWRVSGPRKDYAMLSTYTLMQDNRL